MNAAISASSYERLTHEDCLSCGEPIVHPLCPCCVSRAFKQWLKNFPKQEKEIIDELHKFLIAHRYLDGKSRRCVSCGEKKTHLCPYCFTEYLYKIIKEAGVGPRALAEFLFIFNFDFNHQGYARELEVMGGY